MQSKINYPWEFAPPGFQWAAIDENGRAYWYRDAPIMGKAVWILSSVEFQPKPEVISIGVYNAPAGFDWRKSLQKRPEGQNK